MFWIALCVLEGLTLTTNVVEVAFEEVGTMADSVAYTHVWILIELDSYRQSQECGKIHHKQTSFPMKNRMLVFYAHMP